MEDLSAFSARPRLRALLDHFAEITDARQAWKVMYPLREVLFLVVCGTVASGDDYDDIVDWGNAHLAFLRGFAEFHYVSVLKLVESLESFVFQRRWSDSLGAPSMWTQKNRPRYDRDHLRYPSDLTDEEWAVVAPLIPPPRPGGGKRRTDMRAVVNGLMYILSTGCQWRYLPKDFPPHSTVYNYFVWWQCDRVLDRIHHALYVECRERAEREASPTAAVIDSQSVKSAEKGGPASIRMASMPAS